jgi:hypothetical protein
MVDPLIQGSAVAIMDVTIKAVLAGAANLVEENGGDNYVNFLMLKEILLPAGYESYEAVCNFSSGRNPPTLKHCRTLVKVTSAQL